jgi:AraC-like DNA-binding protein
VADDTDRPDDHEGHEGGVGGEATKAEHNECQNETHDQFVERVKNAVHQHVQLAWTVMSTVHTPQPWETMCTAVVPVPAKVKQTHRRDDLHRKGKPTQGTKPIGGHGASGNRGNSDFARPFDQQPESDERQVSSSKTARRHRPSKFERSAPFDHHAHSDRDDQDQRHDCSAISLPIHGQSGGGGRAANQNGVEPIGEQRIACWWNFHKLSVFVAGALRMTPHAELLIGDADMTSAGRMIDVIDQFAASVGVAIDTRTPGDELAGRWDTLRTGGVTDPGLRFASWVDLAMIGGVIPPLLANCKDVNTLLETLVRFHPLWGDDDIVLDRTSTGRVHLRLSAKHGQHVHVDTRDAFFAILARMLGQVTSPPVQPTREWHRSGDADIVVFTKTQLAVQLGAADPAIGHMLSGYAEAELANNGEWLDRVRFAIRETLRAGPNLRHVANHLAYSPRTLQQRLAERDTSFSELVDGERRIRALGLLANPDLSVSAVAFEVGFRSVEGLSRAVRRWTNTSPTEWRSTTHTTNDS